MVGKDCVAIACDLRLGNQALTVACNFEKVRSGCRAAVPTETAGRQVERNRHPREFTEATEGERREPKRRRDVGAASNAALRIEQEKMAICLERLALPGAERSRSLESGGKDISLEVDEMPSKRGLVGHARVFETVKGGGAGQGAT